MNYLDICLIDYRKLCGEKDFISMSSMKKWILEEDIGKMCAFLISDDSSKVSGQVISVDGHTERND